MKASLLQLPSRKRSRPSSRGGEGDERDSSPSTSTAARSQDRAFRRRPANEGGATSKPFKPARYLPGMLNRFHKDMSMPSSPPDCAWACFHVRSVCDFVEHVCFLQCSTASHQLHSRLQTEQAGPTCSFPRAVKKCNQAFLHSACYTIAAVAQNAVFVFSASLLPNACISNSFSHCTNNPVFSNTCVHRGMIRQRPQQWKELIPEKRRSEVDRRLDFLVNPKGSGALKDVHQNTVLRLLRLFNLCDLGTNSADKDKAKQAFGSSRRAGRPRHVQNAVDQSQVCVPALDTNKLLFMKVG